MKEKFYNSHGCNTAQVTLYANGKEIDLFYHLNDNPVQHIWQELHRDSKQFYMGVSHALSRDEIIDELNQLCVTVGESILSVPVTQEQLNTLHNKFVLHENTNDIHIAEWEKINLYIHALEAVEISNFAEYNVSVVFYKNPTPESVPLKEEHKLWLTTEHKWGRLLLGYGTIGKDWLDISIDNDNLIDLNVQSNISTETQMCFGVEQPYVFADKKEFYQWANASAFPVPLDRLNELALGRYILGELIITDTFLEYNSNASDWYVPNHRCKLTWGKDIIGSRPIVTAIKFFNSDLYFETLIKHTHYD
jgi:hypothetical protein